MVWTIHFAPRWRACTGPDTDGHCIDFFSIAQYILHPEPAIILPTQYVLIKWCSNLLITQHILRRRIDGYCSGMQAFQYHIADVLGEALTYPLRYSKYTLPPTIRVTDPNYSNLKKAIQYLSAKAIRQT